MKNIRLFLIAFALFLFAACDQAGSSGVNGFQVKGELTETQDDSIRVMWMDGDLFRSIAAAPLIYDNDKSHFELKGQVPQQGIYFIATGSPQNAKKIILGGEKGLSLIGSGRNLAGAKVEGSETQTTYDDLSTKITTWSKSFDTRAASNQVAQLQAEYDQYLLHIAKLREKSPFAAKALSIIMRKPFDPNNNPKSYKNEFEQTIGEFGGGVDLADPDLGYIPDLATQFAGTIAGMARRGMPLPELATKAAVIIERAPEGSQVRKNLLSAILPLLAQMKSRVYLKYAQEMIAMTPAGEEKSRLTNQMRQAEQGIIQAEKEDSQMAIGSMAPEIELPDPNGIKMKLSDLRGKIVLIDFWASWCGPCRRENPNVVRMYNKYKSKGFDILSVSLDNKQQEQKWKDAIKQDKLAWNHVSALQRGGGQPARDYFVASIPKTYLVDREGKILARNLRGKTLEAKLAEIFGE